MARYRKKMTIEAVQFKGFSKDNGEVILSERPDWLVHEFGEKVIFFDKPNTLTIHTLEGDMTAQVGDYIVKGIKGEIYPCKPDIFETTYKMELNRNDYLKNCGTARVRIDCTIFGDEHSTGFTFDFDNQFDPEAEFMKKAKFLYNALIKTVLQKNGYFDALSEYTEKCWKEKEEAKKMAEEKHD